MKFTVTFTTQDTPGPGESCDLSYGLVFIPSPCWIRGEGEVLVKLNPESPLYQLGSVCILLQKEKIIKRINCTGALILIHNIGHGTQEDLNLLEKDLSNEGFTVYKHES